MGVRETLYTQGNGLKNGMNMFGCSEYKNVCHDNKILNNVICDVEGYGLVLDGWSGSQDVENNLIKNNIIMNWGEGYYGIRITDNPAVKGNLFQNNCLHKSGVTHVIYYGHDSSNNYPYTIEEFNAQNGTAGDIINSNINANPQFVAVLNKDFNLQSNSPCINTGLDVGLIRDYWNNPVPFGSGVDIGACEYIVAEPLSAQIGATPTSGWIPLEVDFMGSASGGTAPYTYAWTMGDGSSSNEQNPSHTYTAAGSYTVTLEVTDNGGSKDTTTLMVNASANIPAVNLTIATETGAPATGSGGATSPTPGSHQYASGNVTQLAAVPNSSYRFSKWKGDIDSQNVYLQQTIIVMDQNKSVSALFCSKCGDVNGDLNITPADAQAAFDIFLGILSDATECQKENADVNHDGSPTNPNVSPADSQAIFEYFLGLKELPGDCSCNSRIGAGGVLSSLETDKTPQAPSTGINLIVNDVFLQPGEFISVPIIIDNPAGLTSFGFDLLFDAKALEFVGIEKTEILNDFLQVQGREVVKGMARIGGYSYVPVPHSSPDELVRLVFKVNAETPQQTFFLIVHLYDDLVNAKFHNGGNEEHDRIKKNAYLNKIE